MYLSGVLNPIAALKSMLYYGSDLEREEMRQNKVTGGVGERDTGRQGRESMVGMAEDW